MEGLAAAAAEPKTIMDDATYLKAHRTASSLRVKGGDSAARSAAPKPVLTLSKGRHQHYFHAVADANDRPLSFFMTAGQVSDYTGAAALLRDRGYDADWFRDALQAKGIQPCIASRRSRNEPVRYDTRRYRRRSRIETTFDRLRDWRRVATRLTIVSQQPSSPPSPSLQLSQHPLGRVDKGYPEQC